MNLKNDKSIEEFLIGKKYFRYSSYIYEILDYNNKIDKFIVLRNGLHFSLHLIYIINTIPTHKSNELNRVLLEELMNLYPEYLI